jgi:hypothetical protein
VLSSYCYYRWKDAYPIKRIKINSIQRDFLHLVRNDDAVCCCEPKEPGMMDAVKERIM